MRLSLGNYIDSSLLQLFPLEKSDVLVWVDEDGSDGTLTNKITGIGDITIVSNLCTNGTMENDYGWLTWQGGAAPETNVRSNEQKHSGSYSRKVGITVAGTKGIKCLPYTTKLNEVVTLDAWIYPLSGSGTIKWAMYSGDGIHLAASGQYTAAQAPNGAWKQLPVATAGQTQYTETTYPGSSAIVIFYMTAGTRTFYVDDVLVTISGKQSVVLPVNASISNSLVNSSKYYTSGNPINVRTDDIAYNENNQIFYNDDFKILIYNKQVYGNTLISALDWINYDIFETITNIVTVKKDGTGDYLTPKAANTGISDASATKLYRIDIYDDFEITDYGEFTFDGTYYRYIDLKAYVFLKGIGTRKTIFGHAPNTLTDNQSSFTETLAMLHTSGVKNINIIHQNGRYAIHNDSLDANCSQYFKDSIVEHKGNQEIIDYRIANSQLYNNVFAGVDAMGTGTNTGVKLYFDNVEFKGIKGAFSHNNNSFGTAHFKQYNRCKFTASGVYDTNQNPTSAIDTCLIINCLNSDKVNYEEYNRCTFNAKISYSAIIDDPGTPSGISYILADTLLIGANNSGYTWDNISTSGGSLFIKSNSNGSVVITGGTAESVIIPTAEVFDYGRLGQLEVGEWVKNANMKLGVRLGDCSSINKTLTLTVDGTENITITFNENFTAQTNAQVLTFINTALGGFATASLYQRAKDYVPTWT